MEKDIIVPITPKPGMIIQYEHIGCSELIVEVYKSGPQGNIGGDYLGRTHCMYPTWFDYKLTKYHLEKRFGEILHLLDDNYYDAKNGLITSHTFKRKPKP